MLNLCWPLGNLQKKKKNIVKGPPTQKGCARCERIAVAELKFQSDKVQPKPFPETKKKKIKQKKYIFNAGRAGRMVPQKPAPLQRLQHKGRGLAPASYLCKVRENCCWPLQEYKRGTQHKNHKQKPRGTRKRTPAERENTAGRASLTASTYTHTCTRERERDRDSKTVREWKRARENEPRTWKDGVNCLYRCRRIRSYKTDS